jgi:hypothetical protein
VNLIEQLGGYEKTKDHRDYLIDFGNEFNRPNKYEVNKINNALLEYRRQHNIFEVGDQYVMLKLWHDDLMTVEDGEMDEPWWNTRIIRHITNKEREAGHRLPD